MQNDILQRALPAVLLALAVTACGGGSDAPAAGGVTKSIEATLSPLPDIVGVINGQGTNARFANIRDLAMAADGTLLVADDKVLRHIAPDGAVVTLASADAVGSVAPSASSLLAYAQVDAAARSVTVRRLDDNLQSTTVATLPLSPNEAFELHGTVDGKLYGIGNERIVTIAENGSVAPLAGTVTGAGSPVPVDGAAGTARFRSLKAATSDRQGNLYVIDDTLIRKVTPAGVVTTLAGSPGAALPQDGTGSQARFLAPFGLAVDSQGDVLVLDTLSGLPNATLRKVTQAGVTTIATLPGNTVRQIAGNGGQRVVLVRATQVDVLNADGTTTPFAGKE
ncbi:hypothetical protein GJV26_17585 [Massilia dura]|uniref:Uncharacterized protein n=1 Tax=Pseudoduganella dura TaxID=321982 RepID=A0A6I3XCY3_9BURK|nr:hypothetical protein [Pseudoduganella dura]MUI14257.1 hypothetical protein [Pseudoduganella dura]GGX76217.1 hypothetical protein GCM10007386_03840 [Pseudoduganella dura]